MSTSLERRESVQWKAKAERLAAQLAAAEEMREEMRSIVEQMLRLHEAEEADDLWVTCPACNGNQTIGDRICSKCGGAGQDIKEGLAPAWNELFVIAEQALSAAPGCAPSKAQHEREGR